MRTNRRPKGVFEPGLEVPYVPKAQSTRKEGGVGITLPANSDYESKGKILVNPEIQEPLLVESSKCRGSVKSKLIPDRLRNAAKELRNNPDIIVRKADKSSVFVLLDRDDYLEKVDSILKDKTKFRKIRKNPVTEQKQKLNSLIDVAHAEVGGVRFQHIIGDFNPGYFYGNPKTHKPGAPLRPIISQIPTPCYDVAKRLNSILSPYVPKTYSLKSSDEFVEVLRVKNRQGR